MGIVWPIKNISISGCPWPLQRTADGESGSGLQEKICCLHWANPEREGQWSKCPCRHSPIKGMYAYKFLQYRENALLTYLLSFVDDLVCCIGPYWVGCRMNHNHGLQSVFNFSIPGKKIRWLCLCKCCSTS